ncbi:MAG: bifunctional isocitrate dehydrogenase kinase/phosphatase [Betaproteobacteria bacterium]|nr:bifunctional isocitrate dehydrogenase kinase/phosphatase [Betaproteobacteria bacterium]
MNKTWQPAARAALLPAGENPVAQAIAMALIDGFNKHYRLFREVSCAAKERFERRDWPAQQAAVRDRIQYYDDRVNECVERLRTEFRADLLDHNTWQQAKLLYIGLLTDHKQPECAETFFNSVSCKILHRTYFQNDFIFVRPAISTEYLESDPPAYRTYYPSIATLYETFRQIFLDFGWRCPFADLDRDVGAAIEAIRLHLGHWPEPEPNFQIKVLASGFYRNKAVYVIGKIVNGHQEYPFVVPVLHDESGRLALDAILLEPLLISMLFSLSRAYFMVDMEVPSNYVRFLQSAMPNKPQSELYTMLGLAKQGKNLFYRDLLYHLRHSRDTFDLAPGIPGLVMLVFTLPSFSYVFKVIRDTIQPPKEVDRETVKSKYLLVKHHDRVGRMADTMEFSDVALPVARFTPALLEQLRRHAPSLLEEEGDAIVIKHCYIERRMVPLNIYLDRAGRAEREAAVREYGNAIRELAYANIFPGDLLWKNFGVTRYGRVVFYDYDEIEYLTDCNFRHIPEAPTEELEMSGEVWYPVARNDVFPEEFATFLLSNREVRSVFMNDHADLLTPEFWQVCQQHIRGGDVDDFFPYPHDIRFCRSIRSRLEEARPQRVAAS